MPVDVLGEGWLNRRLPLTPDGVGRSFARTSAEAPDPVATLIYRREVGHRSKAVLYIHGFTDYFFHPHHARAWAERGYDFFAIDLRDYGRSIRPGRIPGWITDISSYDEDLDAALAAVRAYGYDEVLIVAHSTGGLIAPLYLDRHPGTVDGLILNSPWLDLNASAFNRTVTTKLLGPLARVAPKVKISKLAEPYGRSLHRNWGGQWDFNLAWKPVAGVPVYVAWLRAIRAAHARIGRGLDLDMPILVATSGRSASPVHATQADLDGADCVLDVRDMWRIGPLLGADVTVRRIEGGRHDLALSLPTARRSYEQAISHWLAERGLGPRENNDSVLVDGEAGDTPSSSRRPSASGSSDQQR